MKQRYVFAPQAARDLVEIWRYIRKERNTETANRVEGIFAAK
jgi:plasmid stabilization system protein ParE